MTNAPASNANKLRFIALCGWPKTGKSEVQKILEQRYGVIMVDDGEPLRDFAIRHCGATWEDVYTQEGKAREVTMPGGVRMTWRKMLGDLGVKVEEMFGPDFIPESAILKCTDPVATYAFGSVRRKQGWVYRRHGGVVVQVVNDFIPPSEHAFDAFDFDAVQYRIENHVRLEDRSPETLALLRQRTIALFDELLGAPVAAAAAE